MNSMIQNTPRFPPYPAYKPSAVPWLGNIPAHWEVRRLKYVSTEPLQYGANEIAEIIDPELPRFIRITDINADGTLRDDSFRSLPEDVARPFLLKYGDILFARSGATVGKSFMYRDSWGRACYAGYLIRARINPAIALPEFVAYFATSSVYWNWISSNFIQATIQNVSGEKYANLILPLPPLEQQKAIINFLDCETARLDALIAKKQELNERLQEKRTALISRAVTKGLDANVRMKDSGVAWLGEVPEGWEVKRLKQVVSKIGSGKTPLGGAQIYQDNGVIFLRSQNVHFDGLRLDDVVYIGEDIDQEMSTSRVHPQDVLLNITGASLGRCSIVPNDFPRANVNQHVCIIRPIVSQANPKFLQNSIASPHMQAQIFAGENGTSREGLTFSQIGNLLLALPSDMQEQQMISEYLDRETARLDALVAKIEDAIERLREYRGALIAAAVTGKMDVREVAYA